MFLKIQKISNILIKKPKKFNKIILKKIQAF
jgi:hypothetical protein